MSGDYLLLELADLAAGQWGLFTTAQARGLGLTTQRVARLARQGTVERLRHGVYRIGGAPSTPGEQVRAAWLLIEPGVTAAERLTTGQPGVVSHRSAARIHDLGDVDADVMEFTVDQRKQSRLVDVRYRVAELTADRWTLVDGLPVTTVLATIEDLAADQLDGGHLAGIVRDAVTTGRADPDELSTMLRPYAHKYGVALGDGAGLLDRFLAEAGVPESALTLGRRGALQDIAARYRELAGGTELQTALAQINQATSASSLLQQALAQSLPDARVLNTFRSASPTTQSGNPNSHPNQLAVNAIQAFGE